MGLHRAPAGGAFPHPAGDPTPVTTGWLMAGAVLGATALALSPVLPPPLALLAPGFAVLGIGIFTGVALARGHRVAGTERPAGAWHRPGLSWASLRLCLPIRARCRAAAELKGRKGAP